MALAITYQEDPFCPLPFAIPLTNYGYKHNLTLVLEIGQL